MNVRNVLEWLEYSSAVCGEKVAYIEKNGDRLTFSQVIAGAKAIGCALKDIYEDTPIAVICGRHVKTIEAFLGVVYSGHAYAPIDGRLPRNRIETILTLLHPAAIVTDDEHCEMVDDIASELGINVSIYKLCELEQTDIDESYLLSVRERMVDTDPLYVIFTSGSTGKPKGVITSHQSLICYIEAYASVMNIESDDVMGNQSPLDYIAAIRDIYLPLYTQASSVIIPTEFFMQPDVLFEYMDSHGVTSVGWSVSAFTVLCSLGAFKGRGINRLKKVCFSGSIMPASTLGIWQSNLPDARFVNQYGPTEATASCTYYEVDHRVEEGEILPIGKPYKNYSVFLLDEHLEPVNSGEIGEICVSGPILALGYYNDAQRTETAFVLNPNSKGFPERMYRTGDYGRLREDGLLEFHGRMDRQIKYMGHRVELDEIECAAMKNPEVQECVALFEPNKEKLYLFYLGEIESRELVLRLREELPDFMVPRKIRKMDSIPKLANGKIDMTTLKESM